MGLIAAFGPIWVLTVTGYLARRYRVLADNGAEVLGQFLFHIAIPAALFVTLGKTPLSGFALRPLAAFAASTAIVIGAGWYSAGRWFGRKSGERAIWGCTATGRRRRPGSTAAPTAGPGGWRSSRCR